MTFRDFVLLATDVQEVKDAGQKRISFKIRVPPTPFGEAVSGVPTEYDAREMRRRLRELEARALDWAGVIRLGTWLGEILFPPPVRELLLQALARIEAEEGGLRLRLILEGPLHNVPWEYVLLNRGGGEATQLDFLGLMPNVSIVRHQAAALPAWDVAAGMPARVVVGLASPAGYASLRLNDEQRAIEAALSSNPRIQATFVPGATPETLLQGTDRAHLFHFAGHGDFQRQMGVQPGKAEGKGYLVLEDGYGDPQPVEADQVGLQLRRAGVRVAVLGACQSGRRDDVNVWSSIAGALLKAELGAVVGMQYTIRDDCAIAFADAFYRALVAGLAIDEAVTSGRIAVTQLDARDWGVPVLYLRAEDGMIFPEYAHDEVLEEERADLRVRVQQTVDDLQGRLIGIKVKVMKRGRAQVKQELGTVGMDAEAKGMEIGTMDGGEVDVKQDVDKVEDGGRVTGATIDDQGRKVTMDNRTISVSQDVGGMEGGARITGVELNVYSYFKATPDRLRRSFDALMRDKLRGFVGRQFVLEAVDAFLGSRASGYFVIRGVPGIGKTALMAKLINDRGYVHHFNIASQNIRSTRTFLENACAQLIVRYDLDHDEIPQRAFDDGGFLVQCLSEAAADPNNHPVVLAIDALDEVDRLGLAAATNILYLPSSLPEGVYVVATTRPVADLRLSVTHRQTLDLEADSEGNLRDITTYIENYLKREEMGARLAAWGVSEEQFVAGLRAKSQGNFMYLHYVLPAIEEGRFVEGTLDELPEGLMAYYRRHWRQMREGNEEEFDAVYEPIVCILGVAQEPVTVQQIANWTRLRQGQVKKSIRLWREFLKKEQLEGEQRYRIYHASFQDFLKEQVDLVRCDNMIADYYVELAGLDQ